MFLVERKSLNTLASNWTLDSTIAADTIARITARKGREYADVEFKAETLRTERLLAAYTRQMDRARIRVDTFNRAPLEMSAAVANILGEAVAARYINPNQFASNLPSVIGTSMDGLVQLMNSLQKSRDLHMSLITISTGC
jgi:hypothetical protein